MFGLIPAHAGKTVYANSSSSFTAAHPRSRGENLSGLEDLREACGSSPLTRGKRLPGLQMIERPRLIPAHAGKTGMRGVVRASCGAHPRSRGENRRSKQGFTAVRGSSPLTRGKPEWREMSTSDAGLIPAHAGKTTVNELFGFVMRAHPRSRGENAFASSSLQVRRWLIPAHAGKTRPR